MLGAAPARSRQCGGSCFSSMRSRTGQRHTVLTASPPASTASTPHQGDKFIGALHRHCWRQHTACPDNPIEENSQMTDRKLEVLTPQNSQIIFIDHQPQMAFGVQSIDRQWLKNN